MKTPAAMPVAPLRTVCKEERQLIDGETTEAKALPFIGLEDIESQSGQIIQTEANKGEVGGGGVAFRFGPQHVLYGKLRPYLNKVALPDFHGRCTTEIIPLLPNAELDRRYLTWFLRGPETVRYMGVEVTGSRMPRADMRRLMSLEIPLPALSEQRRIVAMLDRQMAFVERASRVAHERQDLLDRLSGAVLREAFHSIAPLCIDPRTADNAPSGWRWVRLTEIARLESGHTPSRRHPEWWGGKIPWLALPDIRALHGRIATTTAEATNKAGIANSSARVLPKTTVVLSRTASVGFVTIMGRPMATSQDFVNWVCGPELEPWFLVYLLMASRERLLSFASGAIHKTIYMPTVDGFHICLPPIEAQRAIVERVRARLARCGEVERAAKAETDSIEAMHRALLWHVFGKAA